ncbi:restriction endonuclease subunit S [Coprococcus sp. LG101-27]|uniref:restriction endonuclease subunit S n=1 Tax=Coprococcus sp. LG101-27 TaxID=2997954 RepID=UPI0022E8604C|nr:restriction endonuclease subunit S [Coprococcus sp. LG101-27]
MSVRMKSIHLFEFSDDYKMGLKDYSGLYKNGIPLKEFLENKNYETDIKSGRTPSKFRVDYWGGDYDFITLADVDTDLYMLNPDAEEKITDVAIEECGNMVLVPKGSLLISNAMTVGLAFIVDRDVYINQNVFWVKLDETKVNKKYLLWYFNCVIKDLFDKVFSSKYLSKKELSRIRIPEIDKKKQDEIVKRLLTYEDQIIKLKKTLKNETAVIDTVFGEKFEFDYETFETLKKNNSYCLMQSMFSNNQDMRFSVKYHRPAGRFVMQQLRKMSDLSIKHFLSEPIELGASISTKDYNEHGEYVYISMATIKKWRFDSETAALVDMSYSSKNGNKSVKKYDIIMARSGEGTIGKVALIEEDLKGIFADFTMRIRLEDYNPYFAYYYFRTSYFQYLVEIYKKGLGNNTNIFPTVIKDLPIPNISLKEQEIIVSKIKKNMDQQFIIRKQIDSVRNKILKQIC